MDDELIAVWPGCVDGWCVAAGTGEILKGHVVLGSLRGRQDALMGLGLIQPYRHAAEGSRQAAALFDEIEDAVLQRHRQLAAHEVGHTLGLAHNYMGTTLGADASVMDYPAPVVDIDGTGTLLETAAYVQEIGEFDEFTITYGAQHTFTTLNETPFLQRRPFLVRKRIFCRRQSA